MIGLHDRSRCLNLTELLIDQARQTHSPLTVFWIDLDRFHQINDSFGHQGGDQVLGEIARRLRQTLGESALLASMGADEFVCLLENCPVSAALDKAEALLGAISAPLSCSNIQFHPSASIGVVSLVPGEDAATLLQRADQTMLVAKHQGGNHYHFAGFTPAEEARRAREALEIENLLRDALARGGLSLHYQPIVCANGCVRSVEALMRCQIQGRELKPDRFIPVAEKTGLIGRLGEWTLVEGALYARQLMDLGLNIRVAVNVSRAQLLDHRFAQAVSGALICAGLPADRLELELTESLFLDMAPVVQENLQKAREAGVHLVIDDFGTGYSCLANLKDLPASQLKLDRSFVNVLPEDTRALAIVRAMAQLGRELGMQVVAEGVETEAQRDVLWQVEVTAQQGFLHACPQPGSALIPWLQARAYPHCPRADLQHEHA